MRLLNYGFGVAISTCFIILIGCAAAVAPNSSPTPLQSPSTAATEATGKPSDTPLPGPTNSAVPATLSSPTSPSATLANPTSATGTQTPSDWPTYHRDNARTGYVPDMLSPNKLTLAWQTQLDGAVYAEPLVVSGHVLVATENDSLYSLNSTSGKVEWQTHIAEPVPLNSLPCGNIDPLGMTGTPVFDPSTGLVFVVAELNGPSHVLVGLDARSGEVKLKRSIDPPGMEPASHQQRAALLLSGGMVYVAFGGLFGDCGNYHGWVVASRTEGSGPLLVYQVPTQREGGIWAPSGPVQDAAGGLYVSVGNGAAVAGDWDHSDSILRLTTSLILEDAFAPNQWPQDNLTDADLGSLGPVLLPDGYLFIAGKAGVGYVLHAGTLGGIGGQVLAKGLCHAYGGAAVVGSTAFIPCNEGVQQIAIDKSGQLTVGWRSDGIPGSPVVGGSTVYGMDRGGTLDALDIESGKVEASVEVGNTSRFATPTLYGNRVFVGTLEGLTAVDAS